MSRWFRFYDDALNDPKVQRLPAPLFKAWINLLCIASKNDGGLPELPDLAFMLRRDDAAVAKDLAALEAVGLFDRDGDRCIPHNWEKRQFKSDVSNERVKRHRQRSRNGERNVTETPSESETEQNRTESEQSVAAAPPPAAEPEPPKPAPHAEQSSPDADLELPQFLKRSQKGSRLPADWQPSAALIAWAATEVPRLDWRRETEQFRDYWIAKAGKDGTKLDWEATWRKWMRTASDRRPAATGGSPNRVTASAAGPDWRMRLDFFRRDGSWQPSWGAKPGEEFCIVPADLLAEYGYGRAA